MSDPVFLPCSDLPSKPQLWLDRLDRFASSGLTVAAFCLAEAVSVPSFYYCKHRLRSATSAPKPQPRLLPVSILPSSPAVEVVLPKGTVLRLAPGCDLSFVRSLIAALVDSPC